MVTANFFWHGPHLRLYERACLTSFIQAGLSANVYTFNQSLVVPDGVNRLDARAFAREDEVLSLTQGGKPSIAAFTDLFRYRLFKSEPGWWFDTDVFCLAKAELFKSMEARSKGLLVGEESPGKLNGAVLYISDPSIAVELEKRADAKGKVFDWGDIGPNLITSFVDEQPERCVVAPSDNFYPIHYADADMFFRPEMRDACAGRTTASLSLHLWNEVLGRWHVPQEFLPCAGSYLNELFARTGQKVNQDAGLPLAAFENLHYAADIGPAGRQAVALVKLARAAKRTLLRRPSY